MTGPKTTQARHGFDVDLVEALLVVPVVHPDGPRHATLAPFDGRPLVEIPQSTVEDVDLAFETARTGQARWAGTDIADRKRAMLRFHDLLLTHRDEGLDLIQWETGKTRMDALKELLGVCAVARHYARDAQRLLSSQRRFGVVPLLTGVTEERRPVGLVGVLSPWNHPLYLACADVIPAVMAGNAVVLNPDPRTSLTALWAIDLMHRAGIPRRVVQVVLGPQDGLGPRIADHADHVAFTGERPLGARIAALCGQRMVSCSAQVGGSNVMVVADDAHPGTAAEIAVRACFDNAGQMPVAVRRIYALAPAHDAFVERFLSRTGALRMHAGIGWGADVGSLLGAQQLAVTEAAVARAVAAGARILAGGHALPEIGPFYYAPTVLADVPDELDLSEGTPGPVVAIERVGTVEEAVTRANAGPAMLSATVVSASGRQGARIARRIEAGSVTVNEAYEAAAGSVRAPFGGMGRAGLGRRNGDQGLSRFTEEQTIAVQRGLGFGTPFGMEHEDWGQFLVRGFQALKWARLK
jgi:succinate-semialdehyde dehydrogenase/glutarate-semialdehyde dehydrogenase